MKKLVVVESPTKARTIAGFLDDEYVIESSIGHIRDLPRSAADVPASHKGESWARLGVDTENEFKTLYVVPASKKKQVALLRKLLKDADELYLATDEDREGESIAWHLAEVLKPKIAIKRLVFHEITAAAIEHALDNPRDIDQRLVNAQEARRVLDRLFGYEVSPVLWKKVKPKLSAGRVQSPATRIIVQRERERMAFRAAAYWDLEGMFATADRSAETFTATLVAVGGVKVATGKDFAATGEAQEGVIVLDEAATRGLLAGLEGADFAVRSLQRKPYKRSPYPPFRTSTLQQEAGRKLRFSSARTMGVAQRLYEGGYITYMRTDSITLSTEAIATARDLAITRYGADFVPDKPRVYKSKVKNAQEAHEAIRPAGGVWRTPEEVAVEVPTDMAKLYELIWKRTVASEMRDAVGESLQVRLGATASDQRDAEFAAGGKLITFPGFMRAYVEGADDPDAELEDKERRLPPMEEGDALNVVSMEPKAHETKPPARYTEASLVKQLEELGIGRPSTYASIISTIQDRGYVWKKGSALVPTFLAFAIVALLEEHFPDLVDYAFTARMEDDLDTIANGDEETVPWLRRFYFGNGTPGLKAMVETRLEEIDARAINSIPLGKDSSGAEIVARVGRYGPYLQRGEETVSIREDLAPDELTIELAIELLAAPDGDKVLGTDADSGMTVLARTGRYGPYVQLGELDPDSKEKPRTASLFKSMSIDSLSLEQALQLLSLPRVVGFDPEDSIEITAQNGRYGPYIKKGKESRSLETEEQIFTLTVGEALELLAQPSRRRRAEPLRELGTDPESKKPIVVRSGRYGPYVTDGETNASLRIGDTIEGVDHERAVELLAERRAKVGTQKKTAPKKKSPKRKAAKQAGGGATKTTEKKAAKKPAKKTSAKPASKKPASTKG